MALPFLVVAYATEDPGPIAHDEAGPWPHYQPYTVGIDGPVAVVEDRLVAEDRVMAVLEDDVWTDVESSRRFHDLNIYSVRDADPVPTSSHIFYVLEAGIVNATPTRADYFGWCGDVLCNGAELFWDAGTRSWDDQKGTRSKIIRVSPGRP